MVEHRAGLQSGCPHEFSTSPRLAARSLGRFGLGVPGEVFGRLIYFRRAVIGLEVREPVFSDIRAAGGGGEDEQLAGGIFLFVDERQGAAEFAVDQRISSMRNEWHDAARAARPRAR